MNAAVVDKHGIPDPAEAFVIASSNKFVIHGGPGLYPKEIAGVEIGTLVALALIVGASVAVARYVRKRRSLTVAELSEKNNGERYTDGAKDAWK